MKRLIISFVLVCVAFSASAQITSSTSFFLDNFVYSYRLNPAAQLDEGTDGFFGVGIGNITVSPRANVGASQFLFPASNGEIVTGLHESVSPDIFPGGLPKASNVNLGVNENIFAFGKQSKRSLFTFEANVRTIASASLPKDVFVLLKQGNQGDGAFTFSNLDARAVAFAEAAAGYSYKISDEVKVGLRAKFLIGLGAARMNISRASANIHGDFVDISASGVLDASVGGLTVGEEDGVIDLDEVKYGSPSLPGAFGVAFDLGAEYKPAFAEGLTLSASILDLGGLKWKANVSGVLDYSKTVTTDELGDDPVGTVLDFKKGDSRTSFGEIPVTATLGAKYVLPFYDKLSVGLLGSLRTGKIENCKEARLGLTYTPVHVVSLTATAAASNFGSGVGAAINLRLGALNVFAGMDQFVFNFTPEFYPVNKFNTSVNLGVTFTM